MKTRAALLTGFLALAACAKQEPSAPSKLKAALHGVRGKPPCSSVIAVEWPAGFPVPQKTDHGLRFRLFFYPVAGNPSTGPVVYAPAGEALVDPRTGVPETCEALPGDPERLSERRWPEALAGLGFREFQERQNVLYVKTEAVAKVYAGEKEPVGAAKDYVRTFKAIAEPDLLPYYYRLNPAFWEWVRDTAGDSIPKA